MRDLIFKNLTSTDRKKRVISSSEIADSQGVRSVIRRHFVCLVKEIEGTNSGKPESNLTIIRQRNTKESRERFFCKFKGSICAVSSGKLFLILYMHSLVIDLEAANKDAAEHTQ